MWDGILARLEASAVAELFRASPWLYPAVEIVHIVGFAALVGAAFVLDLRLLGRLRALPLADAVHALSRVARWSLLLVVPSGVLLFVVDATTLAANSAFQWKLLAFLAAGVNAALFHRLAFRGAPRAALGTGRDGLALSLHARLAGVASLVLWTVVIAFGRLIAYV